MKFYSLTVLTAICCLVGCGASSRTTPSQPPVTTGITGNWQLALTSTKSPFAGDTATYGIYLTQVGNTVSGILGYQQLYPLCVLPIGPPCNFPFGVVPPELVGTVDPTGNIVLNSVPFSGAEGVFSAAASSTDNTTVSGIYSITETTFSGTYTDQGTISGYKMANVIGTYAGTVKSSVSGSNMGVTTTLSQTAVPKSDGYLGVSGSASFTGSPCFTSATVPKPGGLLGNQLIVDFIPTNSFTTTIILSGTLSQDTKTMAVYYAVPNACGSDYGTGTLTLQ